MPAVIPAVAAFASTAVGSIVTQVAIGVGAALISSALAPHNPASSSAAVTGSDLSVQIGGNTPIQFPLGWRATAGLLSYPGTWGQSGSTPNAYAVEERVLSFLPVPGKPVPWIGNQKCTVDWNASPVAQGYPILEFRVNGVDYAWIQYDDGTQTTAPAYMVAKFGSHPTRPYTTAMVGHGLARVRITLLANSSFWQGQFPDLLFEIGGIALYDISKDSTAGGSGSHRWGVYSTYEPSSNPAVQIYNLRRGVFYYPSSGDAQWVYGGNNKRALAAPRLPASTWIAAINACNQTVTNADASTEPQFRAGMLLTCDTQPVDAVTTINAACQGRLAENGGIYELYVGAPGAAVFAFTDDDIIISDGSSFAPFPGLQDTYNAVEGNYPEPGLKWASNPAPGRYNDGNNGTPDWESEDGGRQLIASAQFDAVPYANQVQRLMQAIANDNRQFRTHQVTLPPEAFGVVGPNRVVSWTSARYGYVDKLFIVTTDTGRQNWNQPVALRELDPSVYDYDPASQQLPAPVGTIGLEPVPTQPMSGWGVSPSTVVDASANEIAPAITVSCTGLMPDVLSVHVQARFTGTTGICYDGYAPYDKTVTDPAWQISGPWCVGNTQYDVHGKLIPRSGRDAEWSDWLTVTTDNVSAANNTITEAMLVQELRNRIFNIEDDLQSAVATLQNQIGEQSEYIASVDATSQQQITALTAKSNAASAQIVTLAKAVVTTNSALAELTTTVTANFNQLSAGGILSWQEQAGADGVSSSVIMVVTASDGVTKVEAGTYTKIVSDGHGGFTSQTISIADKQYWSDDGGTLSQPMTYDADTGLLTVDQLTVNKVTSASGKLTIDGTTANSLGEEYIEITS